MWSKEAMSKNATQGWPGATRPELTKAGPETQLKRYYIKRTPFRRKSKRQLRVTKDGRLILSGREWSAQRRTVWGLDQFSCNRCGLRIALQDAEIHHVSGRGMGGSRRNDAVFVLDGEKQRRNLVTLCRGCHGELHRKEREGYGWSKVRG